jgi:hypothetical protein
MTALADLRARWWQPRLGAVGETVTDLADIAQAIHLIVTTPKGSDPHRPEFGAAVLQYLDRPQLEEAPALISEIARAILAWEPRLELVSISPRHDLAHVTLAITWRLKGGLAGEQTTEIAL